MFYQVILALASIFIVVMEAFAFLFGILASYGYVSISLVCISIVLFLYGSRLCLIVFFLGAIFAHVHDYYYAPVGMPKEKIIPKACIEGIITSLVQQQGQSQQFKIRITKLNAVPVSMNAQLRCYRDCAALNSGQKIEVTAKLKRPRNRGNPNSFNIEGYMQAQHIQWIGYIRPKSLRILSESSNKGWINSKRMALSKRLDTLALSKEANALITALSLGDSQKISDRDWSLFRNTGTAHLMVISGAHISLVSGFVFFLALFFLKRIPLLPLWIPSQKIAAILAMMFGLFYVLLAGAAVPAQRAWIGCCLFFLRYICTRVITGWLAWRYALVCVLLVEPHAAITKGFYLSFIAVAILLIANQRFRSSGIKKILIMQASCLIGLMPLTLYCFGYGAFSGFFANVLAIPFVGFLMVPLALLMQIIQGIGLEYLSYLANTLSGALLYYLQVVDEMSFLNITGSYSFLVFPIACLVAIFALLLFPKKYMLLPTGLIFCAAFNISTGTIRPKSTQMDIIDVGQGLSILIRTQKHALLYDTGGKYYKGPDMGSIAIVPYLKYLGIKKLDALIISHPDLDHRGGLDSIEKVISARDFIVDDPKYYNRGKNCHTQSPWVWDGVHFEFLALPVPMKRKNNHSCVLRVYTAHGQWLLTGDIERESERWLVDNYKSKLPSRVLVVPHHGSKSSSSEYFLNAVKPKVAVISSGYDNRFHFPHEAVINRYNAIKSEIKNTAIRGLITERLQ